MANRRMTIWDLPLRLVHWSLAVLLAALWWTWRDDNLRLHERLGYVTLGLLLFRLYWGLIGSSTARFVNFVKGPREIAAYLRGGNPASVGHNPLGALSVLLLLGLMVAEVGLGLFSEDVDGIEPGSLAQYVSYETAEWARAWHAVLFDVILAAVALHVAAILFYLLLKRDNLVGPMITGRKAVGEDAEAPHIGSSVNVLVGISLSAALAWWVSTGFRL
jgi:cytochrome b